MKINIKIFGPLILILSILALYFLTSITQYPDYDSSYNASVSKNLAEGLGYSTSYDEYYFNNFQITTGPTILIPASLMIKLFGNQYWIGLTVFIISAILFAALIIVEKRYLLNTWQRSLQKSAIFLLLLFLFIQPQFFTQLYGEIPATLLVIISTIIYFSNAKYKYAIAGILLGLSFITKTIMLILAVPIMLDAGLRIFKDRGNRIAALKKFSALVISFVVTALSSSILISFLNPQSYPKKDGGSEFFMENSGLKSFLETPEKLIHPFKNSYRAMNTLLFEYGNIIVVGLILTCFILLFVLFKRRKNTDANFKVYRFLYAGAFLFSVWWFLINDLGWTRHVMPAFILLSYLVASFMAIGDLKTPYIERIKSRFDLRVVFVILFALIALHLVPMNYRKYFSNAVQVENVQRVEDLILTKNFLEKLKADKPDSIFLGCGEWYTARDLEYVMDTSLNFVKCEPFLESIPLGKEVYLVRNEHYLYLANHNIIYKNFTEKCDENMVYQNGVYKISKCN